jgi:hypothetical protein
VLARRAHQIGDGAVHEVRASGIVLSALSKNARLSRAKFVKLAQAIAAPETVNLEALEAEFLNGK